MEPPTRALLEYAEKVTLTPAEYPGKDLEKLRRAENKQHAGKIMNAENEIYRKFRSLPAVRKLFGAGDRVAVACSGGPDSMALLDLLGHYAPERGLQLSIAHLNHQLRGEDSE